MQENRRGHREPTPPSCPKPGCADRAAQAGYVRQRRLCGPQGQADLTSLRRTCRRVGTPGGLWGGHGEGPGGPDPCHALAMDSSLQARAQVSTVEATHPACRPVAGARTDLRPAPAPTTGQGRRQAGRGARQLTRHGRGLPSGLQGGRPTVTPPPPSASQAEGPGEPLSHPLDTHTPCPAAPLATQSSPSCSTAPPHPDTAPHRLQRPQSLQPWQTGLAEGPSQAWTATLSRKDGEKGWPGRRDGRGGAAGEGVPEGCGCRPPHSPMSVFRHWPGGVQIRLQSNRHSGDLGGTGHASVLMPRSLALSLSASRPRGDSGGEHGWPAPHPRPPALTRPPAGSASTRHAAAARGQHFSHRQRHRGRSSGWPLVQGQESPF